MIQKGKIQEWGNGLAIKLSPEIIAASGIDPKKEIRIIYEKNTITIRSLENSIEDDHEIIFEDNNDLSKVITLLSDRMRAVSRSINATCKEVELMRGQLSTNKSVD